MSGDVTSIPSLTRSGRPSFSLASRPPSGSTLTAFRVRASRPTTGLDYPRTGAVPDKNAPAEAAAHPQAQTPRPPRDPRRPGPGVVHLRDAHGDRRQDPAARAQGAAHAGEHVRVRGRRAHEAGDPPRLPGARGDPVAGHLALD